ncbi:monocarboxylate transporter 10 [Ixodes scapularis]|uniref:monocarboxylate transporter 10 n=1 Tax=Ixodes scapularis TaxID=6945 RepID=UPI001A9E9F86|nr:monocarboxylate transporter 10 [Ixodes scapularis]
MSGGSGAVDPEKRRASVLDGNASREKPAPSDGGWGWLVCLASFWVHGAVFGLINCFGVLYPEIYRLTEDDERASFHTSLVGSVCVGATFSLSPVASLLADRIGFRSTVISGGLLAASGLLLSSWVLQVPLLWITYGGLVGVGASLSYAPSLAVLALHFDRRLGLANGIASAGSSAFTMLLPLPLSALLRQLGLQKTLWVLAVLLSTVAVAGLTFKSTRNVVAHERGFRDEEEHPRECCALIHRSLWTNRKYILWVTAVPLALFGYFVPYVHLVQHVSQILPGANGESLLTCMGATSGIGRIVFGRIADLPGVNALVLQQVSFLVMGLLTMCMAAASHFAVLVALCLALGLCDGCFISLIGPVARLIAGSSGTSQGIGFLLGACSLPLTAGPPIAGMLYDSIGNYSLAFLLAGVPPVLASLLMCCIHFVGDVSFHLCVFRQPRMK